MIPPNNYKFYSRDCECVLRMKSWKRHDLFFDGILLFDAFRNWWWLFYIFNIAWELGTPKRLWKTALNSKVVLFHRFISMYWIGQVTEAAVFKSQAVPISQVVLKTGFEGDLCYFWVVWFFSTATKSVFLFVCLFLFFVFFCFFFVWLFLWYRYSISTCMHSLFVHFLVLLLYKSTSISSCSTWHSGFQDRWSFCDWFDFLKYRTFCWKCVPARQVVFHGSALIWSVSCT